MTIAKNIGIIFIVVGFLLSFYYYSRKNNVRKYDSRCSENMKKLLRDRLKETAKITKRFEKKVWTYWDNDTLPPMIKEITDSWKRAFGNEWKITIVTPSTLHKILPVNLDPTGIKPANYSDWVRLSIISLEGGLWLDASVIVTDTTIFESWFTQISDYSGVGIINDENYRKNDEMPPVIVTWCFMAISGNEFIAYWLKCYENALLEGPRVYFDRIMKKRPFEPQIWPRLNEYWSSYAAAQEALSQLHYTNFLRVDSKEYGFKLHLESKTLSSSLAKLTKETAKPYKLIKLTNWCRKNIQNNWKTVLTPILP
jgi:hypothetical protein